MSAERSMMNLENSSAVNSFKFFLHSALIIDRFAFAFYHFL